jgi:hypothetical protein
MILSDVTDTIYQGAQIYGTEGQITLTTDDLQLLNVETGGKWRLHRPDGKFFKVDAEGERFEWLEGGAAQAEELADWVEGVSDTHRGRAENGYKALEMIHGVYESARCHERVMMPMQTRVSPLDLMVETGHLVHALVQRAAHGDVHLLKTSAHTEHRNSSRHRARDQRQRGRIAMRIVQRAGHTGRPSVTRGLDIRWAAREKNTVDAREDLRDVQRCLEHRDQQRQTVRGLHDRGDVFLADGVKRVRPDHASVGGDANDRSAFHKTTLSRESTRRSTCAVYYLLRTRVCDQGEGRH